MKVLEKIMLCLAILALIMKFSLIPGSAVLLLLSLSILSSIYFYFGFLLFNGIRLRKIFKKESYIGISGLRLAFTICAGLSLSMLVVGIMFKLMYWPGSFVTLLAGFVGVFIALVFTVIYYFKNKEKFHQLMVIRFASFLFVGLFFLMIPRGKLVEFQYRGHEAYIKAFYELENDPTNIEKDKKKQLEYYRMTMSPEEFKRYQEEES